MRLLRLHNIVSVIALASVLTSCGSDTTPSGPTLPTSYDSTGYAAATIAEYGVRSRIAELLELLETANTVTVTLSQSQINAALAPLKDDVDPGFKDQLSALAKELSDASGNVYDWKAVPTSTSKGGVYGSYLFTAAGLDVVEMIEKGLFAGVLYAKAREIVSKPLTRASVHQLLAIYGAHPRFSNSGKATIEPDVYVAAYCARRDMNDGKGLYSQIKREFIRAQWNVTSGSASEASAAGNTILRLWERSQMATVISYTYAVIDGLSKTNVTDSARAAAMHAYGECVGILSGWRFVNQTDRLMTDSQLNMMLELLMLPVGGTARPYLFWQDPATHLQQVVTVREMLQGIYGFTDEEMISFKSNWVNVQGRI